MFYKMPWHYVAQIILEITFLEQTRYCFVEMMKFNGIWLKLTQSRGLIFLFGSGEREGEEGGGGRRMKRERDREKV